jgi:hypothetical protein
LGREEDVSPISKIKPWLLKQVSDLELTKKESIFALLCCALTGVMIAGVGPWALIWVPLGYVFGLFSTAQVVLPIVMALPIAIKPVINKQMRPSALLYIFIVPAVWLLSLAAIGYVFPGFAEYLDGNVALSAGGNLGMLAILITPFSKKGRHNFREDFEKSYARFRI